MAKAYAPARVSSYPLPSRPPTPTILSCTPKDSVYTPASPSSTDVLRDFDITLQSPFPRKFRRQSSPPFDDKFPAVITPARAYQLGRNTIHQELNEMVRRWAPTPEPPVQGEHHRQSCNDSQEVKNIDILSKDFNHNHENQQPASEKDSVDLNVLTRAFVSLGLDLGSDLSDGLIASTFQKRLNNTPNDAEILFKSLRTIAEFKNSSFLKSILYFASNGFQGLINSKIANSGHQTSHLSSQEKIVRIFSGAGLIDQNPNISTRKPVAEAVDPGKSCDQMESIVINGVRYIKAGIQSCTGSSVASDLPPRASSDVLLSSKGETQNMQDIQESSVKESEPTTRMKETCNENASVNTASNWDDEAGTIENPINWFGKYFVEERVQVVVGQRSDCYRQLFVPLPVIEELLHHTDFEEQRNAAKADGYLLLNETNPYDLANLLKLLYHSQKQCSEILATEQFEAWEHPRLYCLARRFHLDHISQDILTIFRKARNFADFLDGVKDVYEQGFADDKLRAFVRSQVANAFDNTGKIWADYRMDWNDESLKTLLQNAFENFYFGQDIYKALLEKDYAYGLRSKDGWAVPSPWQNDVNKTMDAAVSSMAPVSTDENGAEAKLDDISTQESHDVVDPEWRIPEMLDKPSPFADGKTIFVAELPISANATRIANFFQLRYGTVQKVVVFQISKDLADYRYKSAHVSFTSETYAKKATSDTTLKYGSTTPFIKEAELDDALNHGYDPVAADTWDLSPLLRNHHDKKEVTAVAIQDSNIDCDDIFFYVGDRITKITGTVARPRITTNSVTNVPAPILYGACNGVFGFFPADMVAFEAIEERGYGDGNEHVFQAWNTIQGW